MSFTTFTKYLTVILLLSAASAKATHADQQTLWPTDLESVGDCLSDRIFAPMNTKQTEVDKAYCTNGNEGNADAIANCIQNSALKTEVTFFTDKCGSEGENVAFLSVNRKEYRVLRIGDPKPSTHFFIGVYEGDGMKITIEEGTLIPDTTKYEEDELKMSSMLVPVTITDGKTTQKISALSTYTYSDTPPVSSEN